MALKPEQYFWLANGKSLKNLTDLSKSLADMPQDVFNHHVTAEKNDFSNWIKGVFKGEKLSLDIRHTKSPQEMKRVVDSFLRPTKRPDYALENVIQNAIAVKERLKTKRRPGKIKEVKEKKEAVQSQSSKKASYNPNQNADPEKVEPYYGDENSGKEGQSLVYHKYLKEKWDRQEEKPAHFYRNWIKYGFLEFLFGVAFGVLLTMAIKGWI